MDPIFSRLILAQSGMAGAPSSESSNTAAPGITTVAPGETAQTAGSSSDPGYSSFILILVMLVVFYFLLIRPQQKRQKKHQSLLKALKAGDEVITSSGIFGKITEIQGQVVTVEVAKNTKVRVMKNYVAGLANKDTEKELAEAPR